MAEWFKALVLKTSIRKYRKFESCPFRHFCWHKNLKSRISFFKSNLVPSAIVILALMWYNIDKWACKERALFCC